MLGSLVVLVKAHLQSRPSATRARGAGVERGTLKFLAGILKRYLLWATWLFTPLAPAAPPGGSILYSGFTFEAGQIFFHVGASSPDGGVDQPLPLNVLGPIFPASSADGQLLAVTAVDPARPNKVSPDVFVFNTQTGQGARITAFEDIAGAGGFLVTLPMYKAFSRDNRRLAIAGSLLLGGRGILVRTNDQGQVVGPYEPLSNVSSAPVLYVFDLTGASLPITVDLATASDQDLSHRGEGVDWIPNQNQLVVPTTTTVVTPNGTPVTVTALFVVDAVPDTFLNGRQPVQLTAPGAVSGGVFSGFVAAWDDDFQPKVSPDGRRIAYIRNSSVFLSSGFLDFTTPSLRVLNLDGSGDFEVARFAKGAYVTHVDWSPDGARLVFDLGQQLTSSGFPTKAINPATAELYQLDLNSGQITRVRPAPAAFPAWSPVDLLGVGPVTPPTVGLNEPAGGRQFVAPATFELEATPTPAPGRTITRVEFFDGSTRLLELTAPPWILRANGLPAGRYLYRARAFDDAGQFADSPVLEIVVTEPTGGENSPPQLSPIAPQTVRVGETLVVSAQASDPDAGQILVFNLQAGAPPNVSLDAASGVFTWTPTADQVGEHTITVRVTDSGQPPLSASATFAVTVQAAITGGDDRLRIGARRQADGFIQLTVAGGRPEEVFRFEATEAFRGADTIWTPLATLVQGATPLLFTDPESRDRPRRFYRAVRIALP